MTHIRFVLVEAGWPVECCSVMLGACEWRRAWHLHQHRFTKQLHGNLTASKQLRLGRHFARASRCQAHQNQYLLITYRPHMHTHTRTDSF